MAKKDAFLPFPKLHYEENDNAIEEAMLEKSRELLSSSDQKIDFILLTGQFFDTRGWAYSALRSWRGAIKPGSQDRRSLLDATFACMSVYLSSIISFQSDLTYAYDEIKEILLEENREDLWTIIEEKLPFMSIPPAEMFPPGLNSPIAPYYTIKQDQDLFLGELYPSVFMSNYVKNLKSRFFTFFSWMGYTAFGYFNQLPKAGNFGFDKDPIDFNEPPISENYVEAINNCTNLKDLLVIFINCHNNSMLEQFLVEDYESFLNKLLEIEDVEGEDLI